MTPAQKRISTPDDLQRANELNNFYLRFETQEFSFEGKNILETINATEQDVRLVVEPKVVRLHFKNLCTKKATGPDGISAFLLKTCADELTPAWSPIFQKSVDSHVIPTLWKKSVITPVPKKPCPKVNNDFRPVALTSIVMKCFEKIMVSFLKQDVGVFLDPFQFAYRQGRGTDDAISSISHLVRKHLEDPRAYAHILFVDFSSAFNTIQPHMLIQKLKHMNVN